MNFLIGFHGQRRGKPEPGRPDQGVRRLHPLPPLPITAMKIHLSYSGQLKLNL